LKIKPTFFNTRSWRYNWNYNDTNNWLFIIIYKQGKEYKEQNYILRDLKQDESLISYIYKKIKERFEVVEIEASRISKTEYDMLINIGTPTILDCVKIKRVSGKKLSETKTSVRKNYELQTCGQ